ncbi:peptidoglycan-binding domain-containing protein [Marimonas lutisalis]|uniref:peptidoglycan-binding domain-containing protein n=1 Tax=Marimonas lutisalis TaxID=2545756 RepID=UPI0010F67EA8|nr:hypothetical protein [Marimonas lutisalis]
MKLQSAVLAVFLVVAPAVAQADTIVKCVQQGLKEAGFNPRGIDGVIGENTLDAAQEWAEKTSAGLPDLTEETTPRWCAALVAANEAVPEPAPETGQYCIWFEDILSGVWLDPDGKPLLGFRLAAQQDGAGCYAWLNTVPDWQIVETGLQILRITRDGSKWTSGDEENGLFADRESRRARYIVSGFVTDGVLID